MSEPLDKSPDHAPANSAHHDEKKYLDEVIDKKLVNHDVSLDEVIPGSEGVTHRELATLRLVTDSLPFSAWLVTIAEFAERWTYYGTTNLYSNYIRAPLPPGSNNGAVLPENRLVGVAGALGKGQQTSFNIRTFNTFWVYCTPLLGGVLADTLLGRFNTILIFSIVCFLGHIILVATSTPAALANTNGAMAGLVVSILVMGLGAGCIKANVSPLIGEQYQGKLRKKTLESGEVVIVSPQITIQSVYMYFYAAINFGACGAISAAFLARDNGYWIAFLVPTCIFALVPVVLIAFKKNYVVTPPRGSVLLETFRVFKLAAGAHWSWNPVAAWKNFHADDFWDVAKPTKFATGEVPTKITWDDEFVGEVARTFNACKVFLWFPIFWLCYSQIDGNLSTVAAGMRLDGTPNDLILNLNPISIIVMIPIFDYGIYPFLRKKGINFTPIKRICAGFIVAGLAMLYAGVLQHFIYKQSPCHDNEPSACTREDGNPDPANINVWVVSGPYILVGMAEIFASITSLEYAFTKAPKRMKSVVVAFSQFQTAFASALNFALTELNVEQRFGYLFGSFGIAAWVAGFIFFLTFRDYDKQEAELNQIGLGEREGFVDERSDLPHVESGSIKSSTK